MNSGDLSKEHLAIAFNDRATVYLRSERYRDALNGMKMHSKCLGLLHVNFGEIISIQ
jgi:hypothetical protein